MDGFHWAGIGVGVLIIAAAVALAWRDKLGYQHVIIIAFGAVLAGVPVISMTLGDNGVTSVEIGQLTKAASDANGASQTQQQAIAALNDRVTQLASIVSKIPVATAANDAGAAKAATPPVAGVEPVPSPSPVVIAPNVLKDWNADVLKFRQSGSRVDALNQKSQSLTISSKQALSVSGVN